MSVIDWVKDLLSGHAEEHLQNITDAVQNLGDNEVVQNVKDQASELGNQAGDAAGSVGDQAQGVVDALKDKLGQ